MNTIYFDEWEFRRIVDLFFVDPYEAKERFLIYFKKYPKDYLAYSYYAALLIILNQLDDAEKILKYVVSISSNDKDFCSLIERNIRLYDNIAITQLKLFLYQGRYEEAYQFFLDHPEHFSHDNYYAFSLYCKKKLGLLTGKREDAGTYILKQIFEYRENDFIVHIQRHLADYNANLEHPNCSIFASDFPIFEILTEIKKYIPSHQKINHGYYDNLYVFKYDSCGRDTNKIVDYFKILTFHDTSEFITMCPSLNSEHLPYIDLNFLNKNHFNSQSRVKKMSQIDKFNRKYFIK